MRLWDDEVEALRDVIDAEAREFVERFARDRGADGPLAGRVAAMRQSDAAMVVRSDRAHERVVDGRRGPLVLREFRPEAARGVMLHIHGGGWVAGEPALTDALHEILSERLALAFVSVHYRLAPEHPYPAGPDDCEDAALWLLEHAAAEYGCDRLLVGGESAGAHLSTVTLLRLRDRHDAAGRFCGANLVFGAYDLGGTPSGRGIGMRPGRDILDPEGYAFMREQFLPGLSDDERRAPDISPLYADLSGMPPALFTVGSDDHLVDDSVFLAQRWRLAGNEAELLVYPGAPHGCIGLPAVMGHWWPQLEGFLSRCLGGSPARVGSEPVAP